MAEDDWKRRRRREEEREEEEAQNAIASNNTSAFGQIDPEKLEEKIDELFHKASVLIEKCNSLYQQFLNGVERRPPREVRSQLDQVIATLTMMTKPTQIQKFKFYSVQTKFSTHKERWDKIERDFEDGKIQRPGNGGGNRGGANGGGRRAA